MKKTPGKAVFGFAILGALVAILCAAIWIRSAFLRLIIVVVIAAMFCLFYIFRSMRVRATLKTAALILERESVFDKYINATSIPTAILEESGRVFWQNPAFAVMAGGDCWGKNVYRLLPALAKPDKQKRIKVDHQTYKRELTQITCEERKFQILRLIDVEKAIKTVNASRSVFPVMCQIEIDNYGALTTGMSIAEVSELRLEIDTLVAAFAESLQGMLIKRDDSRYFICFEYKFLQDAQKARFGLLGQVREITTSGGMSPTLSIAVGSGDTPVQSGIFAEKAMELAIGRGGDQAVIRDKTGYSFFGGIQHGSEAKSRVRSRSVSKALRNIMEQCEDIYIMGHSVPDMDSMGAALGLAACARIISKPVHIVLDRPNAAISGLLAEMHDHTIYRETIISPTRAHLAFNARSLLIVVDTQIGSHTLAPSLLEEAKNVVVIDHHLRGTAGIEGALLFYHEPYASSAAEMVCEITQYFSDRLKLMPMEAEAMLAGIAIDTKSFSFKTGVRTFEAASYLRRAGADTMNIRHLFQDDMDTFRMRAEVVKNAEVNDGIAIAVCPAGSKTPELLVPQAADELLGIRGIEASFVICEMPQYISVSARSLGGINVQLILEKLGGGGHATIAGAQIKGKTAKEVKQLLLKMIEEYDGGSAEAEDNDTEQ